MGHQPATTSTPLHLLIVDDDPLIRESLRRGLTLEGYRVGLAADAEQAIRITRDDLPGLAVLDILLPGMDGLEVCRRIRAVDPTLPIIMLTARDAVPDRVAGLEAGADDYLIKPFAFEALLAGMLRMYLTCLLIASGHSFHEADDLYFVPSELPPLNRLSPAVA